MLKIIAALCLLVTESAGASLAGRVVNSDDQPIQGAIVVVSTCRPRVGPATTCPSCYLDCTKRTLTDARGQFTIDGLSHKLTFSLAVGAPGHHAVISDYFDPLDDPNVNFTLDEMPVTAKNTNRVRGHVTNSAGQPISGAVVRSSMVLRSDGRGSGTDPSVTSLTLTDEQGNFVAAVGDMISQVNWRVTAAEHAPKEVMWTRSDPQAISVQLGEGASVHGQLIFEGQPLKAALVGIIQLDRGLGSIVTPLELSTDENGFFRFDRLPAGGDYTLYTQMHQTIAGVLPVSLIEVPDDGQIAELGEIATQPARTLSIAVRTIDKSPIPPNSRIFVSRRQAWHSSNLPLQSEGDFQTTVTLPSVGQEMVEISVRVPGYKVLHTLPNLQADINRRYPLRLSDTTDVTIVLAKVAVRSVGRSEGRE